LACTCTLPTLKSIFVLNLNQSNTARHWQLFTHWTDIYGRQEKSVRCEKCITPIDADYNNLLHSISKNFHGPVLNMHEVIYGSWDNAANISHCTLRDNMNSYTIDFFTKYSQEHYITQWQFKITFTNAISRQHC